MSLRIFDIDEERIIEGNNPEPDSLISSAKKAVKSHTIISKKYQKPNRKGAKIGLNK